MLVFWPWQRKTHCETGDSWAARSIAVLQVKYCKLYLIIWSFFSGISAAAHTCDRKMTLSKCQLSDAVYVHSGYPEGSWWQWGRGGVAASPARSYAAWKIILDLFLQLSPLYSLAESSAHAEQDAAVRCTTVLFRGHKIHAITAVSPHSHWFPDQQWPKAVHTVGEKASALLQSKYCRPGSFQSLNLSHHFLPSLTFKRKKAKSLKSFSFPADQYEVDTSKCQSHLLTFLWSGWHLIKEILSQIYILEEQKYNFRGDMNLWFDFNHSYYWVLQQPQMTGLNPGGGLSVWEHLPMFALRGFFFFSSLSLKCNCALQIHPRCKRETLFICLWWTSQLSRR